MLNVVVLHEGLTVVGQQDEQGVIDPAGLGEPLEEPAQASVHPEDLPVVEAHQVLDVRAVQLRIALVLVEPSDNRICHTPRDEGFDFIRLIETVKGRRRLIRVMGIEVVDVEEER